MRELLEPGVKNMYTPWGQSQYSEQYGIGVVFYETPSHGGFKLATAKNNMVPVMFRNNDGWYEEDCEVWKVILTFPELFQTGPTLSGLDVFQRQELALKHLERWFPEQVALYRETPKKGADEEQ